MIKKIYKFFPVIALIGLILLIAASIFVLNRSCLLGPDDYAYSFVMGTRDKVNTISTMIAQGRYFYLNWTGRVLPHILVGLFRSFESNYPFIIANTVVFMVFILTISTAIYHKDKKDNKPTFLTLLAVFGYFAYSKMFGEKFAWMSGACNYLWPPCIMVLFIKLFNRYIENSNVSKTKLICIRIGITILAFLSGATHENVTFVTGAFLLVYAFGELIKFFKNNKSDAFIKNTFSFIKEFDKFLIIVYVVFLIGALINIFAPGNFVRLGQTDTKFSFEFLKNYWLNIIPILAVIISLAVRYILEKKEGVNEHSTKDIVLKYILPIVVATVPMAFISYFPPRAFSAYEALFAIVLADNVRIVAKSFYKDDTNKKKVASVAIASIVFSLLVFGRFSPSTLAQIRYIIPYKDKVQEELMKNAIVANRDVLVSKFEFEQWIHKEDEINVANFFFDTNPDMPSNSVCAQYYGFERITAINKDYLFIEMFLNEEEKNTYLVNDLANGENVYWMEFVDRIYYQIPKDKLGVWKLELSKDKDETKIKDYRIRTLEGELAKDIDYKLTDIVDFK